MGIDARPGRRARLAGLGIGLAALSLVATGSVQAASTAPTSSPLPIPASLTMLDSTYGQGPAPLYFQVFGAGFRPGEAVTLRASIVGGDSNGAPLPPVTVIANDYGQIAATIDGDGVTGPGDGFVIRASGDEHSANIIDLALGGVSVATGGSR